MMLARSASVPARDVFPALIKRRLCDEVAKLFRATPGQQGAGRSLIDVCGGHFLACCSVARRGGSAPPRSPCCLKLDVITVVNAGSADFFRSARMTRNGWPILPGAGHRAADVWTRNRDYRMNVSRQSFRALFCQRRMWYDSVR